MMVSMRGLLHKMTDGAMRPMFAESEPMCYSKERLWGSRTLELFKLTVT